MTPDSTAEQPADQVQARRQQIKRLSDSGKRLGYSLFGIALVAFVVGFFTTFQGATAIIVIVALVVGSVVLAPALVMGYGVRAAEREERQAQQQ